MAKSARPDETIVVTGAHGQIGYEAVRELDPIGKVVGLTHHELDLADGRAIAETIRRIRPRVIVNAAAYTSVDAVESPGAVAERRLCHAVNAEAPGALAKAAKQVGALLVHYSTDYVFDGEKRVPYVEADTTEPLSYYGKTKLDGEHAVRAVGGRYLILRTSWVYGARGRNFMRTILRLARELEELKVVNDQVGAPTWSRNIAGVTADIVAYELARGSQFAEGLAGLYHLSAAGHTTWYDFARCILERDPHREEQKCRRVTAISSEEFAAEAKRPIAKRPAYSVLDNNAFTERFRRSLPDWRQPVDAVLAELYEGAPR